MVNRAHAERFGRVSSGYPQRVAEAVGIGRATGMTNAEIAAAVSAWEIAQGAEPTDWLEVGRRERRAVGET